MEPIRSENSCGVFVMFTEEEERPTSYRWDNYFQMRDSSAHTIQTFGKTTVD